MLNISTIVNYENTVDLLAYAQGRSTTYLNGNNEEWYSQNMKRYYKDMMIKEPEIAYFHKIRAFAIQGHPEGYGMPRETNDYILSEIAKYYVGSENSAWVGYSQIFRRLVRFMRVYPALVQATGGLPRLQEFRDQKFEQVVPADTGLMNTCQPNTCQMEWPLEIIGSIIAADDIQKDEHELNQTTLPKNDKTDKKNRAIVLHNTRQID